MTTTGQMTDQIFGYQAVLEPKCSPKMISLIPYQAPHAGRKEWIYAPAIAAGLLIARTTAEVLANEHLPALLPTVETLQDYDPQARAQQPRAVTSIRASSQPLSRPWPTTSRLIRQSSPM